jgi:UDP-N-acetylmuramate dehydrogenase
MESHREDRRKKGHYRFPSAGSVFKNDRSLGAPTGVLLDSLGLKGLSSGDASVADFHANIIINRGSARAADIRTLVEECRSRARKELHIELEPEIRFVGKWSSLDKGSQP